MIHSSRAEAGRALAADQITTKDKEQIDTDPTEPVHAPGQFESEKRGMINNHNDDRERAEKIEAGWRSRF